MALYTAHAYAEILIPSKQEVIYHAANQTRKG